MIRPSQPIFNNVPPGPTWLAIIMVIVFVANLALPFTRALGFAAGAINPAEGLIQNSLLGPVAPYILHVFLHGGLLHIVFNTVAMVTFGAATARAFGKDVRAQIGFLIFFFGCSIVGALFQVIAEPGLMSNVIGASTGLSGCIVAAGWAQEGYRGLARFALPWAGVNIALALAGSVLMIPISWAGHLGGMIGGLILFVPLLALFGERRHY